MRQCYLGWLPWSEREVQEAVQLARAAVAADRDDPVALAHSSSVLAYFRADFDLAIRLSERAVTLNPNSAEVMHIVTAVSVFCGLLDEGIRRGSEAMRLNPLGPDFYQSCYMIGLAHLFAGRFDEAVSWCERAITEKSGLHQLLSRTCC
jgi:tetratricopeptide (TPR) repeat protein